LLSIDQLATAVSRLAGGELSARVVGDSHRTIAGVATLEQAGADHLSFLANPRYRRLAAVTRAGALVLAEADRAALFPGGSEASVLIVCESAYAWFAFAAQALAPRAAPAPGCAPSAVVHASAQVDPSSSIGPMAVVEEGACIGPAAQVLAGCYVGREVRIGESTRLNPGVRIYHGCRIGARCILHSGCVIGADGFGFAPFRGQWVKIPQTGAVLIGDDVEIGAGSTIDRGAIGDTVIEDGVKIDNLVQIGHNCRISLGHRRLCWNRGQCDNRPPLSARRRLDDPGAYHDRRRLDHRGGHGDHARHTAGRLLHGHLSVHAEPAVGTQRGFAAASG
jgi:UDP-3-O-[3-hydroxymyristoyl] glucosamine N-acyltransferase